MNAINIFDSTARAPFREDRYWCFCWPFGQQTKGVAPFGRRQLFSLWDALQEISRGLGRGVEFECLLDYGPGLPGLPGAQQGGGEIRTGQEHRGTMARAWFQNSMA